MLTQQGEHFSIGGARHMGVAGLLPSLHERTLEIHPNLVIWERDNNLRAMVSI